MTKVIFMGTPDFSVPVLEQLVNDGYEVIGVVTQPDRPKGRKRELTPPPVKVKALELDIPVFQPEKIRNEEEYAPILALKPDLIVTAAYGQILPQGILEAPKYGCINVHASLLPELRGGAPIHYAIMQGKKTTGITIMYMVKKLDAGDIISKVEVDIDGTDNVGSLHDKLSVAGAKLLSETVPKLIAGEITPIPQNDEEATFASNIQREQEIINWSNTGEEIYNQIRGLNPWPVAYTMMDGSVMKVWWGTKVANKSEKEPGIIQEVTELGMVISTGNKTWIQIEELQVAGKRKMSAADYVRGIGKEQLVGKKLGE